jgi:hypothetical protein
MARLKQIVVDSRRPPELARFWAAVLDDFELRAYGDAEIARLAALGLTPDTDPVVIVDGPYVEICFREVDPPPVTKDAAAPRRGDRRSWGGGPAARGPGRLDQAAVRDAHLDARSRGQRLLRRGRVARSVERRLPPFETTSTYGR